MSRGVDQVQVVDLPSSRLQVSAAVCQPDGDARSRSMSIESGPGFHLAVGKARRRGE